MNGILILNASYFYSVYFYIHMHYTSVENVKTKKQELNQVKVDISYFSIPRHFDILYISSSEGSLVSKLYSMSFQYQQVKIQKEKPV